MSYVQQTRWDQVKEWLLRALFSETMGIILVFTLISLAMFAVRVLSRSPGY